MDESVKSFFCLIIGSIDNFIALINNKENTLSVILNKLMLLEKEHEGFLYKRE